MSTPTMLVLGAVAAAAGLWSIARGFGQPTMSLEAAADRLRRPPATPGRRSRTGARLVSAVPARWAPWSRDDARRDLLLVGRTAEAHATALAAGTLGGVVAPAVLAALSSGLVEVPPWSLTAGACLGGAVVVPLALHADLRARARQQRRDLRHQLSAFLDVVTMTLAGNVGNEGALRTAATAGDGRLFVELRRRMNEADTAGRPAVDALSALGDELGIVELQQIAASAALASSEGAPVARSLAAKCSTLRSTLASEDEALARIRTGKLSLPLVGMGLVIMALVVYPALNVSP